MPFMIAEAQLRKMMSEPYLCTTVVAFLFCAVVVDIKESAVALIDGAEQLPLFHVSIVAMQFMTVDSRAT